MKGQIKTKSRSQLKSIWLRYRKSKLAVAGLIMLIIIILIAVFADFIVDYEKDAVTQNVKNRLMAPNREHIFGTDQYGRDMFARIIFALVSL